jgi:8-oxo-dGTP pyrophosphatase MutT (NUDIX family)
MGASKVMDAQTVARLVEAFDDDGDASAMKSRELVLQLLEYTPAPFSRAQFIPGHITSTGLVLHPQHDVFLLVEHHKLNRWLLPGGHVEPEDSEIWDTARREVIEETGATLAPAAQPELVGIDVHGIPPSRRQPFHLHHDLIFAFRATSPELQVNGEVRAVEWCKAGDWERRDLPHSIRLSVLRALRLAPVIR